MTLDEILVAKEGERFEFKEAKHSFSMVYLRRKVLCFRERGGKQKMKQSKFYNADNRWEVLYFPLVLARWGKQNSLLHFARLRTFEKHEYQLVGMPEYCGRCR